MKKEYHHIMKPNKYIKSYNINFESINGKLKNRPKL